MNDYIPNQNYNSVIEEGSNNRTNRNTLSSIPDLESSKMSKHIQKMADNSSRKISIQVPHLNLQQRFHQNTQSS